jgi:hypothetical protein
MISMGCAVVSSSKYLVVQNNQDEIYEVKINFWATKNELYGTLQPPLYALNIKGAELTIYPVCTGRLELFGPPFLPIIWAPKWMYTTGDPMDENNVLRFVYSGTPSDMRIEAVNGIPINSENIGVEKHGGEVLFFLLLPSNMVKKETLEVRIFVKGERKILQFEKTRTTSWHPIIVPL